MGDEDHTNNGIVNGRNINGQFTKGHTLPGNRAGRPPRAQCVSHLLRELLDQNPKKAQKKWQELKDYPTGAMQVAVALFTKMTKGDIPAIKEGLDRVEGKIAQPISGDPGNPLEILHRLSDEDLEAIAGRAKKANGNGGKG